MACGNTNYNALRQQILDNIAAGGVEESQEGDRRVRLSSPKSQMEAVVMAEQSCSAASHTGIRLTRIIRECY